MFGLAGIDTPSDPNIPLTDIQLYRPTIFPVCRYALNDKPRTRRASIGGACVCLPIIERAATLRFDKLSGCGNR